MQNDEGVFVANRKGFHASSLGTGAMEFIPLPFVDEWLIKRQRKSMVESILRARGITSDSGVPDRIVGSGKSLMVRLGSLTRGLILKPLRKLFRSVFFWLTAKNAARTAMVTYFLARFLHHHDLLSPSNRQHLSLERADLLGGVFREVSNGIDLSAAKSAIRELVKLFARPGDTSRGEVGNTIEESAPGFVARFDQMASERLAELTAEA